jgi:predicted unusual protein kinase regulating ubiquinone biosynthesis (AarF/ABC1/UbiB family)
MSLAVLVWRSLFRPAQVSLLSLAFVVAFLAARLFRPAKGPVLLRWYFETSGGGFVKAGQLLAMRLDVVSPAYYRELAKLLDRGPSVPRAQIEQVLESDLGRPVDELFAELTPVAAASIALVYSARTASGDKVAVKVARPGIEDLLPIDLRLMRWAAWWVDQSGLLGDLDVAGLAAEVSRLTLQELDFRREARHIQILHDRMLSDPIRHCAPRVYPDLCGRRVLTMEWFEGVWVTDMLEAVHRRDEALLAAWKERGITPRRTGRILFRSIMEQCHRHRVFHADPHAANLVVLDGGMLGYVDFGIVGALDERVWAQQNRVFDNLAQARVHGTYEAIMATVGRVPSGKEAGLETEVKTLISDWLMAAADPHAELAEKSNGRLMMRIADALRRARVGMSWGVTALYRTKMICDMVVYTLYPEMDPVKEMAEAYTEARRQELCELFLPADPGRRLDRLLDLSAAASAMMDWVIYQLPRSAERDLEGATRAERAVARALTYLRRASWLAALACPALGLVFGTRGPLLRFWWLGTLLAILLAHLIGRIVRLLEGSR